MKLIVKAVLICLSIVSVGNAQVITKEDSLNAGLTPANNPTVISGYGQAKVEYDVNNKTGEANLTRNVLFFGHRFSNKISFFSEMELEDAKVDASGGEISMEQLFLKFNLNRDMYLTAGLFIPRIGIINENHLPTTFNGNDRPMVERLIIPSTWREIGIGLYGNVRSVPGLNYTFSLVNGLNASSFENGTGIREGRFEGREASASNIAATGSLLYYVKKFRFQASGYYGGSCGISNQLADSLKLNNGAFGTPVALVESNIQYISKSFTFKALGTLVSIKDAGKMNAVYDNNTPEQMLGAYAEVGYNILHLFNKETTKNLTLFTRYEYVNMNEKVAENGIMQDDLRKQYIVTGLTYQPVRGISVKLDYVNRISGKQNEILYPASKGTSTFTTSNLVNLGIGYSF